MEENNNSTVEQDRTEYKDGWNLIQSNRAEGWGTSDFFDTYEQALGGVYVSDDIEAKIVRYRYLPIIETPDCGDDE